jgi:hypothetical protein
MLMHRAKFVIEFRSRLSVIDLSGRELSIGAWGFAVGLFPF